MHRAGALLLLGVVACRPDPAPLPAAAAPVGVADGAVDWDDGREAFVGGLAYLDSLAHRNHVVVRLTSWEARDCVLREEGGVLEFPVDEGAGTWRGSRWACDDDACATVDHPLVALSLTDVGSDVGDRIEGSVDVLDASDRVVGTVAFAVPYCGRP